METMPAIYATPSLHELQALAQREQMSRLVALTATQHEVELKPSAYETDPDAVSKLGAAATHFGFAAEHTTVELVAAFVPGAEIEDARQRIEAAYALVA